ncbi:MAG: hypothetical protein SGPRY_004341 [Prymnesium sp.]
MDLDESEARRRLAPLSSEQLLALPHARSLLCGLVSKEEAVELNERARLLLRVPDWYIHTT